MVQPTCTLIRKLVVPAVLLMASECRSLRKCSYRFRSRGDGGKSRQRARATAFDWSGRRPAHRDDHVHPLYFKRFAPLIRAMSPPRYGHCRESNRRRGLPQPQPLGLVLMQLLQPENKAKAAQARDAYLASIPDGNAKTLGVKLGNEVAMKLIEIRAPMTGGARTRWMDFVR